MLLKVDQRTNYPQMTDVEQNGASEDEDEDETPSENCENNRLWTVKPTALSTLRQLLACKMKKNRKHKPSVNPMSNLLRKLTRGSNPDATVTMATGQTTTTIAPSKPMAYRRCLRIRASHARNLSTTHPPLGQVFAPELLQRNSSPTSTTSEEREVNEEENCWNENGARHVLPSSDNETQPRSSFWALRLYNSFRRPKKERNKRTEYKPDINPDLLMSSKVKNSSQPASSVKLLELPARHQPLLHRYGASQFVLLVDWNDAECRNSNFSVTSNHQLRSVMRKPQQQVKANARNKKCVKFQDTSSLNSNSSTSV